MEILTIVEKLTNLSRSRHFPDISYSGDLFADPCDLIPIGAAGAHRRPRESFSYSCQLFTQKGLEA